MALSFIGKSISLISHSDVRYRGILAGIDPQASTIQLSNVYSMGTETRRPPNQFIPPVAEPYQYIIFKAAEVKDLSVDDTAAPPPPRRNVHDDPAVMASAPLASNGYGAYGAVPGQVPQIQQQPPPQGYPHQPQPLGTPQQQHQAPVPQQQQPQQSVPQQQQPSPAPQTTAQGPSAPGPITQTAAAPRSQNRRPNPVHSAAASLETVERALGDLRIANAQNGAPTGNHPNGHRGGRRGGHGRGGARNDGAEQIKVPTTDFDFESMNAKFDKAALAAQKEKSPAGEPSANEEDGEKVAVEGQKEKAPVAYNPQKSFFDTLSSSANTQAEQQASRGAARGGRGHGRGGGRARREEEREKNVATFGEPGGVGLMGPGAYVGGWGGYGRRGGRGRRGGGRGGSNHVQAVPTRG